MSKDSELIERRVLDLTKPVAEQSSEELAATLLMHSGWACLRDMGEGLEIRAAQAEAANRLEAQAAEAEALRAELSELRMSRPISGLPIGAGKDDRP